jgi:hypothetical protein
MTLSTKYATLTPAYCFDYSVNDNDHHLEAEGLIKIQEPHQSEILWMKQPSSSSFETIVPGLVDLFLIGTVHSRNNFITIK